RDRSIGNLRSGPRGARRVRGGQTQRRPGHGSRIATPISDLKTTMSIEETKPGSALDDQLRREQTKAIFDLLMAHRRRAESRSVRHMSDQIPHTSDERST